MDLKPIIGVVGLGTMGLGIAQVYAAAGFRVLATDGHAPARESAVGRLAGSLDARVAAGKLTTVLRDATLAGLEVVGTIAELAPAALVIEAIVEDAAAKQSLFRSLEAVVAPDAVLASNTSSIPVATMAQMLTHPARVLGLHFFNPAPAMKLVELVGHAGTSLAALTLARQITEAAGKTVIACPDRPGFIVNRCARPYYGEALALLEQGGTATQIDAAMLAAGYRLGPFGLIDLIGADINLAATNGLYQAMGHHPRYHPFDALKVQVASGNLGRKTGRGFVFPDTVAALPNAAISTRIEAALINEACYLAGEGVDPQGIDTAMRLGLNFPRGPFETLQNYGKVSILATLAALEASAPPHLKTRYLPAPYLEAA
ncbi:MAG: 3-hydroxyacyl-CoA dehydrogenase NAD-binding domain-containing protein [Paracoccaceae bacterium]